MSPSDFYVPHPGIFYLLAAFTLLSGVMVVTLKNVFHAGLALISTFLGMAALYLSMNAEFLAMGQILIYSGAIAVVILFAVMMTQRIAGNSSRPFNSFRAVALLLVVPLLVFLVWVIQTSFGGLFMGGASSSVPAGSMPRVMAVEGPLFPAIGEFLMNGYMLPFEVISIILLAALVGAIVVAREVK